MFMLKTEREEYNAHMGESLKDYEQQRYTEDDLTVVSSIIVPQAAAEFPDVSFWQRIINWTTMKSKTVAVLIRYSQADYADSEIEYNYSGANGMLRGGYHFYDGRKSPRYQAQKIAELLRLYPPEMEFIMDWERNYEGGVYNGIGNVVATMQEVERLYPAVKWGFYTGYYFFVENTLTMTAGQRAYLSTKPLHIAWYAPSSVVRIPDTWSDWTWWQWGTPPIGYEYGVSSVEIDMNKFNGTEAELMARYGEVEPPIDPPAGEIMYKGTTLVNLNVRNAPNSSGAWIMTMPVGTNIEADRIDNKWWHLASIDGTDVLTDMWAFEGENNGYIRLEETVEPPSSVDVYVTRIVKSEVQDIYYSDGTIQTWRADDIEYVKD